MQLLTGVALTLVFAALDFWNKCREAGCVPENPDRVRRRKGSMANNISTRFVPNVEKEATRS